DGNVIPSDEIKWFSDTAIVCPVRGTHGRNPSILVSIAGRKVRWDSKIYSYDLPEVFNSTPTQGFALGNYGM
ncbi:MAG: hypothetical protein ACPIOQ_31420, partial [Promethearchaeia archaeon]